MKILAIDTSCDETSVAITDGFQILSNIVWSQSSLHSSFGGVFPSLAAREHSERIDWVIKRAIKASGLKIKRVEAIAVTVGPGLAPALSVGINKAKELAQKYKKPLIPVNHIEAHIFSFLALPKLSSIPKLIEFPAMGLVLSGGTTLLCLIQKLAKYTILAKTSDDCLGEALDKGARLLGLGYPGGHILEKFAKQGNPNKYKLPVPLTNDVIKNRFSYSGLKTAFVQLVKKIKNPTRQDIYDLAASFQNVAFKHIENVLEYNIKNTNLKIRYLLAGGGVINNIEIRKRLRRLCKKNTIKLLVPYNKKLNGDNAAMIGATAYFKIKNQKLKIKNFYNYDSVDMNPKLKI